MSKMKHYLQLTVVAVVVIAASCSTQRNQSLTLPKGEYTYNLPCRVVNLHTDPPGRAMLVVWLTTRQSTICSRKTTSTCVPPTILSCTTSTATRSRR